MGYVINLVSTNAVACNVVPHPPWFPPPCFSLPTLLATTTNHECLLGREASHIILHCIQATTSSGMKITQDPTSYEGTKGGGEHAVAGIRGGGGMQFVKSEEGGVGAHTSWDQKEVTRRTSDQEDK